MKYIIMCGGIYDNWDIPRQLTPIMGEAIVVRTIRLLRENGIQDIMISSNNDSFNDLGVPVLHHDNAFHGYVKNGGNWVDGFYLTDEPTCYLFGDVVFSPQAIKTIVETNTDEIDFFASAPPFAAEYIKRWEEPFAFKVVDTNKFALAVKTVKDLQSRGRFMRTAIAWELWQVIKNTPLNRVLHNYVVINDYTCDVDKPEDAIAIEKIIRGLK